MVLIPSPTSTPPTISCHELREVREIIDNASPLTIITGRAEKYVVWRSYVTLRGRMSASIPIKCMAHIPIPMATAPATSHFLFVAT